MKNLKFTDEQRYFGQSVLDLCLNDKRIIDLIINDAEGVNMVLSVIDRALANYSYNTKVKQEMLELKKSGKYKSLSDIEEDLRKAENE